LVVVAIDGLATVLAGEQYYFMGLGSTASDRALQVGAEKLARERGEA
jgi:hypothetical protein